MKNQSILITGATGGIGRESALELARMGATVYIVGRNPERGRRAEADIRQQSGNSAVHFLPADLATQDGVRALAESVRNRTTHLDALINNAGGLYGQRQVTVDGYEAMWMMNHLGPVQLTGELLPLLEAGAPSRVINLTSSGHRFARVRWDNLQGEKEYVALSHYGTTKLVNLMVMYHWSPELHQRGVQFFAADPGGASTEMTGQMRPEYLPRLMRPMWPLMRLSFGTGNAEESRRKAARSTVYAASSADLADETGLYIAPGTKITRSSGRSYDASVQARLWELTRDMLPEGIVNSPALVS